MKRRIIMLCSCQYCKGSIRLLTNVVQLIGNTIGILGG